MLPLALLIAAVAASAAGAWHQYSKVEHKYEAAASARDSLSQKVKGLSVNVQHLQRAVAGANERIAAANRRAAAANERAAAANARASTTFDTGLGYGRSSVFDSFDWQDGGWYLIKVQRDEEGLNISQRFDQIVPCQWMYLSNDQMFTQGYAC